MQSALIISKDLNNVDYLNYYLEELNYGTTILNDAEEIKTIINSSKPDLIFLDIVFSKTNGFKICRQLKKDSDTNKIPIVFLSYADKSLGQTWIKIFGAEACLYKPIKQKQLEEILQQLTPKQL